MEINVYVKPGIRYQEIDGFGVCGAFRQSALLMQYPEPQRTQILDMLFSTKTGAGFSIVRNIIGDSGVWGCISDGPTKSIEPTPGEEAWDGDEDQIWFMREASIRGCNRFISTVWSPPAWMKTNGSVDSGGSLKHDLYGVFAEYLVRYAKGYEKHHGLKIFAISCANEPQFQTPYSSCLWTEDEISAFYKDYLNNVIQHEAPNLLVFGPETENFGNKALSEYANAITGCLPNIVAMHGYGGNVELIDPALLRDRKLWLTEISDTRPDMQDSSINDGLKWAEIAHNYLTDANVNAFIFFWAVSKYMDKGISLLSLDLDKLDIIIYKRLFSLGQYSRFIRPGYHRVYISSSHTKSVLLSAYEGEGRLVIVAVNQQLHNVYLNIHGINVKNLCGFRTSATESLKEIELIRPDKNIELTSRSITTLTFAL